MALVEVKVPDIGDFKEVEIIEMMVKVGDTVKAEQSLLTVESDKASMEIPCSHAGVVKELKVKIGDKVAEGTLVLMLEVAGAGAAASAPAAAPAAAAPAPATPPRTTTSSLPNRTSCSSARRALARRCSPRRSPVFSMCPSRWRTRRR